MLPVQFLNPAEKYLKKLKDKALKQKYREAIMLIRKNPKIGEPKVGDLAGIWEYDISHNGINYKLAYTLGHNVNGEVVVIIMAGTRENFWDVIKRYLE